MLGLLFSSWIGSKCQNTEICYRTKRSEELGFRNVERFWVGLTWNCIHLKCLVVAVHWVLVPQFFRIGWAHQRVMGSLMMHQGWCTREEIMMHHGRCGVTREPSPQWIVGASGIWTPTPWWHRAAQLEEYYSSASWKCNVTILSDPSVMFQFDFPGGRLKTLAKSTLSCGKSWLYVNHIFCQISILIEHSQPALLTPVGH